MQKISRSRHVHKTQQIQGLHQSFMKTTVANVFPVTAALVLPCWKRKELSKRVVINSTTILNKEKFGFNTQNGTTDLM